MRNLKVYAEDNFTKLPKYEEREASIKKQDKYRKALRECRDVILELKNHNDHLENDLEQKNKVVNRLIQEKQKHLLHMTTCDSQNLIKKVEQQQFKRQQLSVQLNEISERYERIIEKNNAQIYKIKSYNRALRVQNASLRQQQEKDQKKKRKVGSISSSTTKDVYPTNSFQITQINSTHQQEIRQRNLQMIYQTPQTLKSLKSANLPSTQQSKTLTEEKKWRSKQLPKNLFKNQFIQEFNVESESQQQRRKDKSDKKNRIDKVIKRVKELLEDSDEN